jgi:hypothetical protein
VDAHRIDCVLRRRAEDIIVMCTCGWTSPPMPSLGLAEATFSFHLKVLEPALTP